MLAGSAWGSAGSSGCSPTSPRRSCRPHSVFCSARNPPAAAAAPGLRAGCSRASSVTLRVAPQAAAPAISAKRRPGAPPRGFLSAGVACRRLQDVQDIKVSVGAVAGLAVSLRLKGSFQDPFFSFWSRITALGT